MTSEPHINALVKSLEFIAKTKPETTLDQALPVVDAVFALHNANRGDAVRVDDLLTLAKRVQEAEVA